MTEAEKQGLKQAYVSRFQQYGYDLKTLGWGTKGRVTLRYEILLSRWDMTGKRVLDFGCGFGHLALYMKESGIKDFEYIGTDINTEIIEEGKRQQPELDLRAIDIFDNPSEIHADYVLACGVFYHPLSDNWRFIEESFTLFSKIAKSGFAVNFFNDRTTYQDPDSFYADPARVLTLAYKFSNNVVLRNDYMPYEFTVFVDLDTPVEPKRTVYMPYSHYR